LEDVERAAELYVTPRFKEALAFASNHQQCATPDPWLRMYGAHQPMALLAPVQG
jgi:hypothetical protein